MTRLLINDGIKQKAEEDLMRLLIGRDLEPNSFNYSPFILRCVNEKLLENGYSLGLGDLSKKSIIDKYWEELSLPIENDVVLRVVDSEKISNTIELIVLIKNREVQISIWSKLKEIKKLSPKNDRIYRGSVSTFGEISAKDILNDVITILSDYSLSYITEKFVLTKDTISIDNFVIDLILPEVFSYTCKQCNLCELPSNYSINPIPNTSSQPYSELFSERRIGFPSNMVSTSISEVSNIAFELKCDIKDIAQPILFIKRISGEITDNQLALKQELGICIFQNLETKLCDIHDVKPISCRNYPFMINQIEEGHFSVEVDFSCPGISSSSFSSKDKIVEEILSNILQTDQSTTKLTRDQLSKWDLSNYFADKTRVRKEDIDIALKYIQEDYNNSNNCLES